jgi:TonB-dependent starch-binding outer membrane protein SusC
MYGSGRHSVLVAREAGAEPYGASDDGLTDEAARRDAPVPDPFEDIEALEALEHEITTLAAHDHAREFRLLRLIAEFDRRRGWELGGHRTCAHWLHFRTGYDLGSCRERVRVARALGELPLTAEAMSRGELSFSKVRALTRAATPECEAELLEVARSSTTAQLERFVRAWRKLSRRDEAALEREGYRLRRLRVFPDEVGTYDWQDAMLRRGMMRRFDISAAGGDEDTRFYLSLGHLDHEGTVHGSSFNRLNFRANLDHQATERLSLGTSLSLSRNTQEGVLQGDGTETNWTNSPFHGGVTLRVTTPIYNEDGTYNQDGLDGVMYNLVQVLDMEERIGRTNQAIGSLSANYEFTPDLQLRSHFGVDYRVVRDYRFNHPEIPRYGEYGGSVTEITRDVTNWNTNAVLTYNRSLGEGHNLRALFGGEYRQMYRELHGAPGRDLPSGLFQTIDMAALAYDVSGSQSEYRTAGVFSRLQYNYDQRFFASANVRTDGHSRFGADERWGVFYSGALAWDMAQEGFMQDLDFISELRPRIAYGVTGNSALDSNFAALPLIGGGGSYEGSRGLRPSQLGNAVLTWEEARSLDLAVDFGLFNHRIYGNIGVYQTHNDQLLMDRWLPSDAGFSSIMENVGTVRNQGLEMELGALLVDTHRFRWRTTFNATYQRSKVVELVDDQEWISDPDGGTSRVILGEPRHQWWVRDYAGVNVADGRPLYYDQNGELTYSVSSDDFVQAGSMDPDYYGGLHNELTFGPASLGVFFQYEFGSRILDEQYTNFHQAPHRNRSLSPVMWGRWTEPGDVTDIPRAYNQAAFPGGEQYMNVSTRRLFDGSYIRFKNITFGYTLPAQWAQSFRAQSVSIFAQAENLVTWTAYPGLDPEVIRRAQTYYPQPRTFTTGIEIDF